MSLRALLWSMLFALPLWAVLAVLLWVVLQ